MELEERSVSLKAFRRKARYGSIGSLRIYTANSEYVQEICRQQRLEVETFPGVTAITLGKLQIYSVHQQQPEIQPIPGVMT